ncbi:MAG TPA: hypothetical protein VLV81_04115 [Acidimicrobiia bacterium]|nr:hypothetical protein [Acidimicrobiia bacterium]
MAGPGRRRAPARATFVGRGTALRLLVGVAIAGLGTVVPVTAAGARHPAEPGFATIHVGGIPDRVVVGAGAVWVGDGGRVSHIDPGTGRIRRVRGAATPIAVGAGALWARAHDRANALLRIEPTTNRVVATIDLGVEPGAIAVTGTDVWVANPAGTVVRIDASTNSVRTAIWVGSVTFGIAADPATLWVSGRTFDDRQAVIWRIDPNTNAVAATIATPVNCDAIADDAGTTWAECINAHRIDPSTNVLHGTGAAALDGLAVADGSAWALGQARSLARISNLDNTIRTVAVPAGSEGIAVGFGAVWVANPDVAGVVTRDGQGSLTRITTRRFGPPSCAACDQTATRAPPNRTDRRSHPSGTEPQRARSIA